MVADLNRYPARRLRRNLTTMRYFPRASIRQSNRLCPTCRRRPMLDPSRHHAESPDRSRSCLRRRDHLQVHRLRKSPLGTTTECSIGMRTARPGRRVISYGRRSFCTSTRKKKTRRMVSSAKQIARGQTLKSRKWRNRGCPGRTSGASLNLPCASVTWISFTPRERQGSSGVRWSWRRPVCRSRLCLSEFPPRAFQPDRQRGPRSWRRAALSSLSGLPPSRGYQTRWEGIPRGRPRVVTGNTGCQDLTRHRPCAVGGLPRPDCSASDLHRNTGARDGLALTIDQEDLGRAPFLGRKLDIDLG